VSPQEERDVRRILLREPQSQLASSIVANIEP
jgi:hypothetical protein